jgi:hypothetical protein
MAREKLERAGREYANKQKAAILQEKFWRKKSPLFR